MWHCIKVASFAVLTAMVFAALARWHQSAFAAVCGLIVGALVWEALSRSNMSIGALRLLPAQWRDIEARYPAIAGPGLTLAILSTAGTIIYFAVRVPSVRVERPATYNASGPMIEVMQATFGESCGAPAGNVTHYLKQSCQGLPACTYRVYLFEGDPFPGCLKDFKVDYRCTKLDQDRSTTVPAPTGEGEIALLFCQ